MGRWLARGLLLVLLVVAGAWPLGAAPAEPGSAAQSLALLQQADLQSLAPPARQQLLLGVAAQQAAAGQGEAALALLGRALGETEPLSPPLQEQLRAIAARLELSQLNTLAAGLDSNPNLSLVQRLVKERQAFAHQPAIGVLLPLTGRYAPYGELLRRGIELARTTLPAANGIRFVYHDTAGDGATMERLVDQLGADPAVLAVLGPLTSGEAPQATVRAAAHRLPLLLLAPREGTTASAQGLFRLTLTAEAQVRAVTGHAVQTLGLKRFALLVPATRQGEHYAGLFEAEVLRLGGQLVAHRSYAPESVDLRAELQELAAAVRAAGGAEALFLPDDPRRIGQIAPQLGFARLDQLQLLGIASWHTPELMRLGGPALEGALLADSFCAESSAPPVAAFIAAFRSAHGSDPTPLDALGFDSANLLLTALTGSDVHDRTTLVQALAGGHAYPGITGAIRFTPAGDADIPLCLLQVQDGTFVVLN